MDMPFPAFVDFLATRYAGDERIDTPVGTKCKQCEFAAQPEQEAQGLRSGFKECWERQFGLKAEDFAEPNVFEIWNCRKTGEIIEDGKFLLRDIVEDDVSALKEEVRQPGLSASQRQHLQLAKARGHDPEPYLDSGGMRAVFSRVQYPLHFIDFETSAMALPFHAGRHPYEGIAFQFSHHIVEQDGTVRHAGQHLNTTPGTFPNYDFIRALKRELEQDNGSIFRYAVHENTYLLRIYDQLQDEDTDRVPDRDGLCDWIRSVTTSQKNPRGEWDSPRSMVDMRTLVLRYYYDPFTHGSNSIKAVLPAVLHSSQWLKERYSQPVYGAVGGIPSLNFADWTWVQCGADGQPRDPYKLLPPIDVGLTAEQLRGLEEFSSLDNGGAAMMAYARLQFENVSKQERQSVNEALLRYCELDTLAMVMIWEAWREMLRA